MANKENEKYLDDEQLVANIVETNNTDLFAVLYDRYAEVIYNKCLGFTNSVEEAQDLTHDILVQLFIKLRTFKGKSKFSTWLYALTYNFCVNYVQRGKKKTQVKLENDGTLQDFYDRESEIDEGYIYKMKSEKLKVALEKIEPNDKMILLMKYQDDLSVKEIQKVLELNMSAVKMRLSRARKRLLEIYQNL